MSPQGNYRQPLKNVYKTYIKLPHLSNTFWSLTLIMSSVKSVRQQLPGDSLNKLQQLTTPLWQVSYTIEWRHMSSNFCAEMVGVMFRIKFSKFGSTCKVLSFIKNGNRYRANLWLARDFETQNNILVNLKIYLHCYCRTVDFLVCQKEGFPCIVFGLCS